MELLPSLFLRITAPGFTPLGAECQSLLLRPSSYPLPLAFSRPAPTGRWRCSAGAPAFTRQGDLSTIKDLLTPAAAESHREYRVGPAAPAPPEGYCVLNFADSFSTRDRPAAAAVLAILLLGAGSLPAPAEPAGAVADTRLAYSDRAPDWLGAVGKLRVPGSRYREGRRQHLQEDCSATLVSRRSGNRADTIVTAWHCLAFYSDLSRPITFLLPGQDRSEEREAYRVADGGGMHADWAVLRLFQPVVSDLALAIHPDRADPARPVSMAGYSRDPAMGDGGTRLTFDPSCLITRQWATVSDTDCVAYKGASGGAVVQLSLAGEPELSGVVSQGNGAGLSIFVPVAVFRSAVMK